MVDYNVSNETSTLASVFVFTGHDRILARDGIDAPTCLLSVSATTWWNNIAHAVLLMALINPYGVINFTT
jgi:hypothetical protein